MNEPATVQLLSVQIAAQHLGISRAQVYRLMDRGAFRRVKVGHRTLVRGDDLTAYVEAHTSAWPVSDTA